jgi:uncharacterized RDD family membrane protein YckC
MGCPKCQCEETSASGICLWCGYQISAPAPEDGRGPKEKRDASGKVEPDYSRVPDKPPPEEPPQSQRETSRGPVSIKQKRKAVQAESPTLPSAEPEARLPDQSSPPPATPDPTVPFPTPVKKTRRRASRKSGDKLPASSASPSEPKNSSEPEKSTPALDWDDADSRVALGVAENMTFERSNEPGIPANAPELFIQLQPAAENDEGGIILLSRTLSGLVDLIVMMLSTGTLVVGAHYVLGMHVRDSASLIHWSVLFMLVYFMYSLLFIGISNQTIGMMITDLQLVVRKGDKSPRLARIFVRCCGYLVSILCLGIGLLWALFDPEHQCLHDRLTNTRVVRVSGSRSKNAGSNHPEDKAAEGTTAPPGASESEDSHNLC